MRSLLRPARPPRDAPIEVIMNLDLTGVGDRAEDAVDAALLLLAQGLDQGWFVRLTITGTGSTVEWHQDGGWEPALELGREEGLSISAVLAAFGGVRPTGPAPEAERTWPAGHFQIRYRGKTHSGMVETRHIAIGTELIAMWDDGLGLAYHSASESEQLRMMEDSDLRLALSRLLACGGRVVDPVGENFMTIRSAVEGARPGTRIFIKPGTYHEELVISNSVQLFGEGAETVRIVGHRSPSLRLSSRRGIVHGIGFELARVRDSRPAYAVAVTRGEALFSACEVTSDSAACVAVVGKEARPTFRACTIRDGAASGLIFDREGGGLIEGCEITGNAADGVRIAPGGDPILRDCRIRGNGRYGVYAGAGASAHVHNCDLRENGKGAWGLCAGHGVRGKGNVL